MGVQNCAAVLKYLMVFFNFLFFLLGIVVLGFGIYARIKQGDYDSALVIIEAGNSEWESFGSLCIAIGVFIALLGGSGCFGAAKEHRGCLVFFAVLVILIFLLECTAGGLGYHYRGTLNDKITNNLNNTLNLARNQTVHNPNGTSKYLTSWNTVQKTFHCCGITNGSDWKGYVPISCFPEEKTTNKMYAIGCKAKVFDVFTDHWKEWAGGVVGIALVQLLSVLFAILLIREIGKEDSYTVV